MRTAIFSNKGGVGKSSLTTNLAAANAVMFKEPTLIIDFDGQANTTSSFMDPSDVFEGTSQLMLGTKKVRNVVQKVYDNLYLVPADQSLNELEFDVLLNVEKYKKRLFTLMKSIDTSDFKQCFFDLPPSLGLISTNVMGITDRVCIPYVPEPFSLYGLVGVIKMIKEVQNNTNRDLKLAGVIANKVDSRINVHKRLLEKCIDLCSDKNWHFFNTIIKNHSKFPDALFEKDMPAILAALEFKEYNTPQVNAIYELLVEIRRS